MKVARNSLAIESGDTYKKRSKLSLFSPRDFQESQQAVLSGAKEESRIVLKTFGARSFAAAQDDSLEAFFRSL
jgi:hypothetical protein